MEGGLREKWYPLFCQQFIDFSFPEVLRSKLNAVRECPRLQTPCEQMVPIAVMSAFVVGSWCIALCNRTVLTFHSQRELTLWKMVCHSDHLLSVVAA